MYNSQLRLESFEKCDGGYKPSDVLVGGACDMMNQLAKENFQDVLGAAGVEPRDCPIAKVRMDHLPFTVIDRKSEASLQQLPNIGYICPDIC